MTDPSAPGDAGTAPQQPPTSHARGRSRVWTVLVVVGVILALAASVVAGVLIGRATAPGPDVIITGGPVVEESPAVPQLPVGVPTPEATPVPSASSTAAPVPTLTIDGSNADRAPVALDAGDGLSDTTTTASGYRLVNAGISRGQVAAVLASVFGVQGTPKATGDLWSAGDPGGPSLTVSDDPLVSWEYDDPQARDQPAVGPPMATDRAITLTAALLGSIGVDTASIDWQVDRYSGMTSVTAWQLVAGARTQLAWRIGFDPSGAVVEASGFSAGFEEVPGYPVVGAATAVTRSTLPGWSSIGPTLISAPDASSDVSATASASASPFVVPSLPALAVPLTRVTVTGADLGLAQYWQSDGGLLILPAYVVAGEDGSRWSLLAVGDDYVQFVDTPVVAPSS